MFNVVNVAIHVLCFLIHVSTPIWSLTNKIITNDNIIIITIRRKPQKVRLISIRNADLEKDGMSQKKRIDEYSSRTLTNLFVDIIVKQCKKTGKF